MSLHKWKPAIWILLLCCWTSTNLTSETTLSAKPVLRSKQIAQAKVESRFLSQRGLLSGRDATRRGISPASARLRSRLQHRAMSQVSAPLNTPWQSIGPQQVVTAAYGAVTGRVAAIAVDPSDHSGNTVYVGTTGGGVWKSTNAAGDPASVIFLPLTDQLTGYGSGALESISIGALSVQPGGTGVVIAGTGDPNDALDSYYGSGILRSTDGGSTWRQIPGSRDGFEGGMANFAFIGEGFAGFAWSTANSSLVVAAVTSSGNGIELDAVDKIYSTAGLYYSTDAGATWFLSTITDGPNQIIQAGDHAFAAGGNAATAIVWNPVRQKFYAAIRYRGYYDSPDGITFTRLAHQPGVNFVSQLCPANPGGSGSPSCPIFRGAIAAQPVTGDMFAITTDVNNLDQGIWQDICSLTSGSCASPTVTFAKQLPSAALEAGAGDATIVQADYNLSLVAIPSQQDTILFAGTEDIFRCSLAMNCAWRNTTNVNTCAAAMVAPSQHAIDASMAASQLLYFGNDGGVWRSSDNVKQSSAACSSDDSSHFQNLNSGLGSLAEVTQFAEQQTNAAVLMVGLGANGTAATAQAQSAWPQVLGGEGSEVAIDPQSPFNWYASSGSGVSINQCTQGTTCDSTAFGLPLIGDAQVGGDSGDLILPAPWILDPQDSTSILVGTCRVWRGPSTGNSWTAINAISPMLDGDNAPFCSGNGQIRSLAASGSPSDSTTTPEFLYAGMAGRLDGGATASGHVYRASYLRSANTTPVWTDLYLSPVSNGGLNTQFNPAGYDVSSIVVDAHDPSGQTVYVSTQGFSFNGVSSPMFYRTVDAGQHWLAISNNIPDAPANSIAIDPNDANTVYVGLDTGIYITRNITTCSTSGSGCWSTYGAGLPDSPVTQLGVSLSAQGNYLRAATYGRGLWQIPLITNVVTQTTATLKPTSLVFASQPTQTSSGQQSITVTNTGTVPLVTTSLAVSSNFREQDNCSTPVQPQASCSVQVTFTPATTGPLSGTLTVFANIGGGQLEESLSGTGIPGGSIVLTPSSLTYGSLAVGTVSMVQNVVIANTGGVPVTLRSPAISGDFQISANTCTGSLTPNNSCTLSITFTPSVSGSRTGVLTIVDDAGTQTVPLSGNGLSPATDAPSPTSLTFAAQIIGTTSAGQQVTLSNTGDSPLKLIGAQASGDFVVSNGCGNSLIGHSTCAFTVSYVPSRIAAVSGTLTVTDMLRQQTVALSGTGLAPAGISATPRLLDFGNVAVGSISATQIVTVSDSGGVELNGITTTLSGDYAISSTTCKTSLAVGGTCQIALTFKPTQAGARSGNLSISSPNLQSPLTVSLSGAGEDFQLLTSGSGSATITSGQSATYTLQIVPLAGSNGTLALTCSGAPANATCTINPASLQMVSGTTGSATVTIVTGVVSLSASLVPRPVQDPLNRLLWAGCLPLGLLAIGRRRRTSWLLVLCAAAALLLISSCSTASSGGGSTTPPPPTAVHTTPSGTYTLTITGSVPGLQRTTLLNLVVE